tara:strand:+ start:549 stop:1322 length:774 start_codon:yes stop_codon:yes gene_type:complete
MKFIDTHSHLYSSKFDQDRRKVIKDAINLGVEKFLLPNISSKYTERMNDLCAEFPSNCFPMMGLHPCEVNLGSYKRELQHVEKELLKGKYIGVGEIGLDLFWDKSTLELQRKTFIFQIKLAKKLQLPIAIHVRDSFSEAIEIVESLNDENLRGVFHCFTGNVDEAKRIVNLGGFYLGIGGVLTFKNSKLDSTIKKINLKHLILETDSPYLSPAPYRGKRNESKYIITIAKKLAEINDIKLAEVAEITTKNAKILFKV